MIDSGDPIIDVIALELFDIHRYPGDQEAIAHFRSQVIYEAKNIVESLCRQGYEIRKK